MTKAEEIDAVLGRRLRLMRESRHYSQKDLAQKVGVVFQQIQKYEVGVNRMSCGRLIQILRALDITLYEFFADLNCCNAVYVSRDECELLKAYRNIDRDVQRSVIGLLCGCPKRS